MGYRRLTFRLIHRVLRFWRGDVLESQGIVEAWRCGSGGTFGLLGRELDPASHGHSDRATREARPARAGSGATGAAGAGGNQPDIVPESQGSARFAALDQEPRL